MMSGTIVLGYDGSECAKAALATAVEEAKAREDGTIAVVAAHPLPLGMGAELGLAEPAGELDRTASALQALLDEAEASIKAAGVPVETHMQWEDPCSALLDVAGRSQAAMIVVGTHGEGAVGAMVRGSTTYKLLHRSTIPLLVVPHPHQKT